MVCRLLQCLFLLRLCQEVILRGFRWFFFFDDLLCRKRKVNAECVSLPHEWNRQSHTAGKSGRMTVAVRQNKFHRIGNIHTSFVGTCPFHASGDVFSLFRGSFFTDFLLKFFLSNLPPLPFTSIFASFSEPHQAVISVLGAKVIPGLDGNARSSLLFSVKISSPAGSIFPEKPCIP